MAVEIFFTLFSGATTPDEIGEETSFIFWSYNYGRDWGWKPPSFSGATTLDEIGDRKLLYFERDWE
jgi:hypothetical protein